MSFLRLSFSILPAAPSHVPVLHDVPDPLVPLPPTILPAAASTLAASEAPWPARFSVLAFVSASAIGSSNFEPQSPLLSPSLARCARRAAQKACGFSASLCNSNCCLSRKVQQCQQLKYKLYASLACSQPTSAGIGTSLSDIA